MDTAEITKRRNTDRVEHRQGGIFFPRKTLSLHFLKKIIAVLLDHKICGQKDENYPDKKIKEKTLEDLLPFS